jgi:transcriptional repressor NrdR
MRCPFCAHDEDKVVDSRTGGAGDQIRRRRECERCNRRFTTYERVEDVQPVVVKKDGRRELFDRAKLTRGITAACIKRPVSADAVHALVDGIERELTDGERREISAPELGERVLRQLRLLDPVAYVRFASVYRSFSNAEEFVAELERLRTVEKSLSPSVNPAVSSSGASVGSTASDPELRLAVN